MTDDIQLWEDYKLPSSHILGGICSLVKSLLITDGAGKHKSISYSSRENVSEEVYQLCLVELVPSVFTVCFNFKFLQLHAFGFSVTEIIDLMAKYCCMK